MHAPPNVHERDLQTVRVNAAIIGSGQAGPPLAAALAAEGESVALFEGHLLGGTCVNTGCTPTKTLRKSARVAHLARRAGAFGIQVGDVTVDFAAVMGRVTTVVSNSREGLTKWMTETRGVTLVREWAQLNGREGEGEGAAFVVRAGAQRFLAERVYLNVGASAGMPPIAGLEESGAMVNDDLLAMRVLPEHLLILGGSYIGVELGQIFRRLGSAVTIIESAPTIVSREDPDVSERLAILLRDEGVQIVCGATVQRVSGQPGREITVEVQTGGAPLTLAIRGTHLLVATGRTPNTAALGLDSVGVTRDAEGYVTVNGTLETNVPGIWALGDVNRRGAFTHTSYQDYEIVLANRRGRARSVDGRIPTYALFTDPPIGRVGINERAARQQMVQGGRFLQVTHEMSNVSRAKEESETTGVMKLLIDADTERFVGATIFGIGGDEIVQTISAMMAANAPYQVLRDFLPIHPTVTEFFPTILGKLAPLE
jgi:pyruvate/2-oxoglutarate dehydrogenase complex dihydrolipoamide dehydrogenase (E3) component